MTVGAARRAGGRHAHGSRAEGGRPASRRLRCAQSRSGSRGTRAQSIRGTCTDGDRAERSQPEQRSSTAHLINTARHACSDSGLCLWLLRTRLMRCVLTRVCVGRLCTTFELSVLLHPRCVRA
eukprot:5523457-Prymnesium_polylepis.3